MTHDHALIANAPQIPGEPIMSDLGVVGWAQTLYKPPPPFLERAKMATWEPEVSREGGWRRMVWSDVLGWAYSTPMDIVHPSIWAPLTDQSDGSPHVVTARSE